MLRPGGMDQSGRLLGLHAHGERLPFLDLVSDSDRATSLPIKIVTTAVRLPSPPLRPCVPAPTPVLPAVVPSHIYVGDGLVSIAHRPAGSDRQKPRYAPIVGTATDSSATGSSTGGNTPAA